VEVHCDEGVAIHIDPEPCVHVRESMCEASVGERIPTSQTPPCGSPPSAQIKERHRLEIRVRWRFCIRGPLGNPPFELVGLARLQVQK
jgi:hypothetical protein